MEATVSIICLVIIVYILIDLYGMDRRYNRKPPELTEQEVEDLRKASEESFTLRIKLQAKIMEDLSKPPLWVSMTKGAKEEPGLGWPVRKDKDAPVTYRTHPKPDKKPDKKGKK